MTTCPHCGQQMPPGPEASKPRALGPTDLILAALGRLGPGEWMTAREVAADVQVALPRTATDTVFSRLHKLELSARVERQRRTGGLWEYRLA